MFMINMQIKALLVLLYWVPAKEIILFCKCKETTTKIKSGYMYRLSWCQRAKSLTTFSWEWTRRGLWTLWTGTRTGSPSGQTCLYDWELKNNITADFNCGLEMHNGGGSTQAIINEMTVFFQISHGGKDQNQWHESELVGLFSQSFPVEKQYGFLMDCQLYILWDCCLVFSLIQAQLGSISIQEFGLTQDTAKIFRNGMRISKCMLGKSGIRNTDCSLTIFLFNFVL